MKQNHFFYLIMLVKNPATHNIKSTLENVGIDWFICGKLQPSADATKSDKVLLP
jgi:hypothetical protein